MTPDQRPERELSKIIKQKPTTGEDDMDMLEKQRMTAGEVDLDIFEKVVTRLSGLLMLLGGICVVLLMLHVVADVALKYFAHRPIVGTLEIVSWYYMVGIAFLPVAWVQWQRRHLMVEMFTMRMSHRATAILDGVVAILTLAYVSTLTVLVYQQAVEATARNEIQDVTFFDMPVWPSRWILVVAFGAMTLVIVLQAIIDFRFGLAGKGTPTFRRKSAETPLTE